MRPACTLARSSCGGSQSSPGIEEPVPAPAPAPAPTPTPTAFEAPAVVPETPRPVEIVPPPTPVQPEQHAPVSNRPASIELTIPPPAPPPPPAPMPVAAIPSASAPVPPRRDPRAKTVKLQRRIATLIAAAALAFWATATIISRSSLKASEQKANAPAVHTPVAPASKAAPEPPPAPIETSRAPEPVQPAAKIEKTAPAFTPYLRSRVKTLWEAGRYADAMDLVDNFLSESPANAEAQVWKKRIRAAQDAEAAIK